MKKICYVVGLLFFTWMANAQNEDCLINEFCYSFDECINDSTYRVRISFSATQEGPWNVYIDGDSTFSVENNSFSESLLLRSEQLHTTALEWGDHPDCFTQLTLPARKCPRPQDECDDCELFDLFAEHGLPDENCEVFVEFEFHAERPCSDSFYVNINGRISVPYPYGQQFYRIGPFEANGRALEMFVFDAESRNCISNEYRLELPECEDREDCRIWDLEVEIGDILNDSTFTITVDFNHRGTNPAGFDLFWSNQFYGYSSYSDLPLSITVESRGLEYEIIRVSDNDNPDCHDALEFMSPFFSDNEEKFDQSMIDVTASGVHVLHNVVKEIQWFDALGRLLKSERTGTKSFISHPIIGTGGVFYLRWKDNSDNYYAEKVFLQTVK